MTTEKTFLEKTIELINGSELSIPEIARACGVNTRWLRRVADGDYQDPGVNKIVIVHNFLLTK